MGTDRLWQTPASCSSPFLWNRQGSKSVSPLESLEGTPRGTLSPHTLSGHMSM